MAAHVRPTLAPALVALWLLELLALAIALLIVQVTTQARPCVAMRDRQTLAPALVALWILGLFALAIALLLCKLQRRLHPVWQ